MLNPLESLRPHQHIEEEGRDLHPLWQPGMTLLEHRRRLEISAQAGVMLNPTGGRQRFRTYSVALTSLTIGSWNSLSNYYLPTQLCAWLATSNLLQISHFSKKTVAFLPPNSLQSLRALGTQLVLIKTLLNPNLPNLPGPTSTPSFQEQAQGNRVGQATRFLSLSKKLNWQMLTRKVRASASADLTAWPKRTGASVQVSKESLLANSLIRVPFIALLWEILICKF